MQIEKSLQGKDPIRRLGLALTSRDGIPRLSAHLGQASQVLLVDERSSDRAVLDNTSIQCGEGTCGPVDVFISFGVDAVICRSLGKGAYRRLAQASIKIFRTHLESIEEALIAFRSGKLKRLAATDVCTGSRNSHRNHGRDEGNRAHAVSKRLP